jgi:SurA N-terminal domain
LIAVAPPPVELPANTIAIVADVRAGHSVTVSKADFHHALVQAAVQDGRKAPPKRGEGGFAKLERRAIGELLDSVWIGGQAAEMGIGVRPREVRRQLAAIKQEAFKSGAEYRRFLRQAHYTRRDVLERVETQILSAKIQERVAAGIRSEAALQKAFAKFVAEYSARWRARTVCAPGYVIERCSNS